MHFTELGHTATGALMRALSTTIKPGLVDRKTKSGRRTFDFLTHVEAIGIISPWLFEIAEKSIHSVDISPTMLLTVVRKLGVRAEIDLLKTYDTEKFYKGAIFHMGLSVAAAGRIIASKLPPNSNSIGVLAAEMCSELVRRELDTLDVKINVIGEESLTSGERMYLKYENTGARGEAQGGYATVRKHALPVMRELSEKKHVSMNDVYVQTFMTLMANIDDTGVADKENYLSMEELRDRAKGILERGGVLTPLGREKIEKLDEHLNSRKIYPGASGALLAVAIFMHMLEEKQKKKEKRKKK